MFVEKGTSMLKRFRVCVMVYDQTDEKSLAVRSIEADRLSELCRLVDTAIEEAVMGKQAEEENV